VIVRRTAPFKDMEEIREDLARGFEPDGGATEQVWLSNSALKRAVDPLFLKEENVRGLWKTFP
jgi:hypothetical protein